MIKAVLFDLDDTLVDHTFSARAAARALAARWPALGALGEEPLFALTQRTLHEVHPLVLSGTLTRDGARLERLRRMLATVGVVPTQAEAADSFSRTAAAYKAVRRMVPGSLEVLLALRARGIRIGLVTNNLASEQWEKIGAFDLKPLLDAVCISEEVGFAKPRPEIFRAALDALGVEVAATSMVGDSWESDVLGARGAGLRAVWFNRPGAASPDISISELRSFEDTTLAADLLLKVTYYER